MEHSLNGAEHRVQIKAKYFWKYETECGSLWSDVRVTRGRVDNENNSQSPYLNMLNTYMSESLIYEVKNIAGSQGYWKCEREHSNMMYT